MTIPLKGNWRFGVAYDVHTTDSVHLIVEDDRREVWGSNRTEMGQLLYDLKYEGTRSKADRIVELLDGIEGLEGLDLIVPAPSSNFNRAFQPVVEIARALGVRREMPMIEDLLYKDCEGEEIKNVDDLKERGRLLRDAIHLNKKHDVAGKRVLLVDDLYRSGATLTVATEVLYQSAGVRDVYVLAMTKTRSRK